MDLKDALNTLEKDAKFISWRKKHKDDYFSYAFRTFMDGNDDEWQLGYYNKQNDSLTTFVLNGKITIREGEEVFKKPDMDILEIKLDDFKMTLDEIMKKANSHIKSKYPNEKSIKIIAVLQNLSDLGLVWNMTFITETFNVLNMKINASNGKILQEKLEPIISFKTN